jgi:hypothetical protein
MSSPVVAGVPHRIDREPTHVTSLALRRRPAPMRRRAAAIRSLRPSLTGQACGSLARAAASELSPGLPGVSVVCAAG